VLMEARMECHALRSYGLGINRVQQWVRASDSREIYV
jgi:hypothetical protein